MKTEQTFGFIITDAGFEYNPLRSGETYDLGRGGSTIVPHVYPTKEEAEKDLVAKARNEIGTYQVGVFSDWDGYCEPAMALMHQWGFGTGWDENDSTYELFFQEAGKRNVDASQYLPNGLYEVHRVEFDGSLKLTIEVPDEQIKAATESLVEIHKDLS